MSKVIYIIIMCPEWILDIGDACIHVNARMIGSYVYGTVHNVQCTLYTIHCIVYSVYIYIYIYIYILYTYYNVYAYI